ncbi:MAG: hypothetical protein QXO75_04515 [Nitrososphaerota archaeon]
MSLKTKDLFIANLKRLIRLPAPSYNEEKVAREFVEILGLEWEIDETGNVISKLSGGRPANICLAAHMDQVYFKSGEGFFESEPSLWHLPNVEWYQDDLREFVESGQECIQTLRGGEILRVRGYELSKDSIKVKVEGDKIVPNELAINVPSLQVVEDELLFGSPLDDRVGLAALIHIALYFKLKPFQERPSLIFLGTVAEEAGYRSEIGKVKDIENKVSILIDSYCPFLKDVSVGKGPVIEYYEEAWSRKAFRILCEMRDIYPMQIRKHEEDYITSLKYPVGNKELAVISFPLRRLHTSSEVVSLNDLEHLLEITIRLIEQLG